MPLSTPAPADWKACRVVVVQQWLLELIVAVPNLLAAIDNLDLTDTGKELNTDLKKRLAFAFDILPDYLQILKAWSNTLCRTEIKDLGAALSLDEYKFVNKKIAHSLQLIAKSHVALDLLSTWSWGAKRNRARVSDFAKQSMRAYETVQSVVARVDELYQLLSRKKDVYAFYKELRLESGVQVFEYFWRACMDTLHELRVVDDEWDKAHLRLFQWGGGLFKGPMALDQFLRWPENRARVSIGKIIMGAFSKILFFSERALCLLIRDDRFAFKRDVLETFHKKAVTALCKDELFVRGTGYWNMMTFPVVAAGWKSSLPIELEKASNLECVVGGLESLERMGYTLITERPRLLARRQAQAAPSTTLTASPSIQGIGSTPGSSAQALTVPIAIAGRLEETDC